jgi:hypothetical protein
VNVEERSDLVIEGASAAAGTGKYGAGLATTAAVCTQSGGRVRSGHGGGCASEMVALLKSLPSCSAQWITFRPSDHAGSLSGTRQWTWPSWCIFTNELRP